jgi:hypothetical protein
MADSVGQVSQIFIPLKDRQFSHFVNQIFAAGQSSGRISSAAAACGGQTRPAVLQGPVTR